MYTSILHQTCPFALLSNPSTAELLAGARTQQPLRCGPEIVHLRHGGTGTTDHTGPNASSGCSLDTEHLPERTLVAVENLEVVPPFPKLRANLGTREARRVDV